MVNIRDFDIWNVIKKDLTESESVLKAFPKEGEVWMIVWGKNIGYEQNGSGEKFVRPGLVIKKFNNHMFWVAPLSTKQKKLDFYYNFRDIENNDVSVILAQMRLVSIKRFVRDMYKMETELYLKIIESMHRLLPYQQNK